MGILWGIRSVKGFPGWEFGQQLVLERIPTLGANDRHLSVDKRTNASATVMHLLRRGIERTMGGLHRLLYAAILTGDLLNVNGPILTFKRWLVYAWARDGLERL